ncbi:MULTISPECIES: hypothetical protein [unclassified Streptomyces]|uniref:hypothetical protein n=1 Tax=unclassified Streptomyces TaxID=2593676 RepID=UPI000371D0FE|nr:MULTISPECIES: hypothetical protein [unclassified Streptomyces]MYY07107.1 hypothetical protein [Streptomyces sp. SID4913]
MNSGGTTDVVTGGPDIEEAADPEEPAGVADDGAAGADDGARPGRRWPRVVAGVLAVVLVAAGAALYVAGRQLRDTPATSNLALTDSAATNQVAGEVTNALGKVFSYSPDGTAATKASARKLLAGKALQQYAALFGQVEKQSADQKLTLTTHVVRAGVTRLTPDSAHLLVFLDQVYEREGKAASKAAAQLSVTAQLREGHWTIVEITPR